MEASGKAPGDLSFFEKVAESEELNPSEVDKAVWEVLYAANKLRNKIAHTFDQAKIKTKMDALRAAYLAALTPTQAETSKTLDDPKIAVAAMGLCGAFLCVATDSARKVVKGDSSIRV